MAHENLSLPWEKCLQEYGLWAHHSDLRNQLNTHIKCWLEPSPRWGQREAKNQYVGAKGGWIFPKSNILLQQIEKSYKRKLKNNNIGWSIRKNSKVKYLLILLYNILLMIPKYSYNIFKSIWSPMLLLPRETWRSSSHNSALPYGHRPQRGPHGD